MAGTEKRLLPTRPEFRRGLVLSAICAVLTAPVAYIIREVLDEIGLLDGVAHAIAGQVRDISPTLAGWLFALVLAIALQALIVWWLRPKPKHVHHKEVQAEIAPEASLQMEVTRAPLPQRQTVLYVLTNLERAPTRVVGDGTLIIFMLDVWTNGFGFTRKHKSYSERQNPEIDWGATIPLVQKCVITNYGSEPLTDIRLMVDGEVRENKATPTGTESGEVIMSGKVQLPLDKLDPGEDQSFTFYIQNRSRFHVWLQLKDAEARPIGTRELTRVPVDTNAPARHIALFPAD
jgi:hypothetical protein